MSDCFGSIVEEICEYNGQAVLFDITTSLPVTEHDCGYDDCPLSIEDEAIQKEVHKHDGVREVDLSRDDWGMAQEWMDEFSEDE